MTVGQVRGILLIGVLYIFFREFHCLVMPLEEKNITRNDIFFELDEVYAKTQPEEFKGPNISFSGKILEADNLTLDEKCKRGLPLSVRWTNYGPYASIIRSSSGRVADGVGLSGIFPHVINRALSTCCHGNTRVEAGELIATIKTLEKSLSNKHHYDMMFPVGLQNMDMKVFKDLPVVPLLRAPRTTLVVPESNEAKTSALFVTVGRASPILGFIFLSAILSGVFIWVFDHLKNPDEFPKTFISGVWEGFWWAVVTMTTVGYGDRAPRSILGRLFCILWIVIGMSIIAIFTAMITASLSASIQYRFIIHGSKMGSVDGSQEERIGTGMNADIKTYKTPTDVLGALVDTTDLEVAIMDNYLLSFYHRVIASNPVRIKSNLEQPINYGLVLAPNSSRFTNCFRRFVRNNPQEVFDIIRRYLKPLKNPTDDVSEELKASRDFLREEGLRVILYYLMGSLAIAFTLGFIWECLVCRLLFKNRGKRPTEDNQKKPRKGVLQSLIGSKLARNFEMEPEDMRRLEMIKQRSAKIRQLIQEYDEFYEKWLERLKDATGEDYWSGFNDRTSKDKNGSFLMVTYNGNQE